MALLKGKRVDLRILEKEDFAQWHAWFQDPEVIGPHVSFSQMRPWYEAEKNYTEPKNPGLEFTRYFMQKKDGTKIGGIAHFWGSQVFNLMEVGYFTIPSERGHGFTTEALQIMVDHLFLSRNLERIQATTDTRPRHPIASSKRRGSSAKVCFERRAGIAAASRTFTSGASSAMTGKAPRVLRDPAVETGNPGSTAVTPPTGKATSQ